ncbi:TPA: hypothetical protein HA238_00355 [Candidatus Micrarchaeota archaeon]|nr:hypothetical protein [Candidatus Micrarchaeota archaeon]
MRKYLVNSTYCIYLLDIGEFYSNEAIFTIKEVAEEIGHERGIELTVPLTQTKKTSLQIKSHLLSNTDILLLQTAKAMDFILVTDDQKIIIEANRNGVHALDTPHFIHRLLVENKWAEERAFNALNKLRSLYNRGYIIDKVIKDITNWR